MCSYLKSSEFVPTEPAVLWHWRPCLWFPTVDRSSPCDQQGLLRRPGRSNPLINMRDVS